MGQSLGGRVSTQMTAHTTSPVHYEVMDTIGGVPECPMLVHAVVAR